MFIHFWICNSFACVAHEKRATVSVVKPHTISLKIKEIGSLQDKPV